MIACVDFVMALRCRKAWTNVMVGLLLGFTAASWLLVPRVTELKKTPMCSPYNLGKVSEMVRTPVTKDSWQESPHRPSSSRERSYEDEDEEQSVDGPSHGGPVPHPKHFLYVGVMTAKKYLDSRAVAVYKTWAPSIPGKVEFFSSQGSDSVPLPFPLPVVSLPGVDDSYPPQKKSFMMLKYMHDHYLDKFEWFMRADDDVYIRGEEGFWEVVCALLLVPSVQLWNGSFLSERVEICPVAATSTGSIFTFTISCQAKCKSSCELLKIHEGLQ